MKLLNTPAYPFTFGLFVVLSWVVFNPSVIRPIELIRPIVFVESIAAVTIIIFYRILGNFHKAGDFGLLILVFLFYFGYFSRFIDQNLGFESGKYVSLIFLAVWTLVFFVVGLPVYLRRGSGVRKIGFTHFLNIGSTLLLIIPVLLIWDGHRTRVSWQPNQSRVASLQLVPANKPDIYYILLDGYGRSDVLSDIYDYDNSAFIMELEEMGFKVATESHANYMMTMQSLSSTLNMAYLPELGLPASDFETWDRTPLEKLIHQSALRMALENIGYQFVVVDSGFAHTKIIDADVYLSEKVHLSKHEELLLSISPLSAIEQFIEVKLPIHGYYTHQQVIRSGFEQIRTAANVSGPKFVFIHIMAPHPPFVFDKEGQPILPDAPYSLRDGDNYPGPRAEYIEGYRNQISFISSEIVSALKMIIENSQIDPIIVLQGDHGPGAFYSFHFTEKSCFWERAGILNAYYLPDSYPDSIYPSITPVNTFRVVLNHYFDAGLDLIEDASFNTTWSRPYDYIPITDFDKKLCAE